MTKATFDLLEWMPCDSRADMDARANERTVVGTLVASDPNSWGYFQTPDDQYLNVGYANVGLQPQAVVIGARVLVGINECLAGYDLCNRKSYFFYRMPFVFHEFVELDDPLIVRDEVGFIGLTAEGVEVWKFCTEEAINRYEVTPFSIVGETIDGTRFSFELPTSGH